MPRMNRLAIGDTIYHVINRANGRATIFKNEKEYKHFEALLEEAKELLDMRILAYCIMPNHWHLVLYPRNDGDMSEFMRWLTTTHVRQHRVATKSIGHGHVYQGAYKSFPVEKSEYLTTLIRYVEQNPLRAKLVKRAEDWRYSSLYRRMKGTPKQKKLLAKLPVELPHQYLKEVNTIYNEEVLETIRHSVQKGTPMGGERWAEQFVRLHKMQSTVRTPGRPRKS
jgi:putative transposase